ncbi:Hypothetical_protein [Hexamita inflata]|uniref:Hypothetical_protein n=1 Tax=Hexamita inflata TaxID=28002 RepID=A0AA86TY64_9EUKA|nr:Hypothetical protein HINF_LOCUS19127 [Hexamita inflata]
MTRYKNDVPPSTQNQHLISLIQMPKKAQLKYKLITQASNKLHAMCSKKYSSPSPSINFSNQTTKVRSQQQWLQKVQQTKSTTQNKRMTLQSLNCYYWTQNNYKLLSESNNGKADEEQQMEELKQNNLMELD